MEKSKLVIANHKMTMNAKEISEYLNAIKDIDNKHFIVCPSSIYLPYFLKHGYDVGIQNIHYKDNGAYTGEISAKQISSMGVNYVILGHSERRNYFKETDEVINLKIKSALENHIKVILCIGELKRGHNEGLIKKSLINALKGITDFNNIIIAYEPVWAIGTSVTPTNIEITKTILFIKNFFKKKFSFENITVLYGGSVSDTNISTLNEIEVNDGYLIGGASTNIEKIRKIIEVVFTR